MTSGLSGTFQPVIFPLESVFIYSCSARKAYLNEALEREFISMAQFAPQAGFFTYGEFYHGDKGNDLLNITTTILGLSESATPEKRETKSYSHEQGRRSLSFSALTNLVEVTTRELSEEVNERREKQSLLEQYKNAIDTMLIVSKTSPEGIITYANEHFCQISGYTPEELYGRSHNIVRHPDTPKKVFKEMWNTITSKHVWQGVIKNLRKDGGIYYVKSTIIPLLDNEGEIIEYIGLREDITDFVDATRAIESERDRTYTILDQQESIVVVNNKGGKIKHINQKFFELFPYPSLQTFLEEHDCICELFIPKEGYLLPTTPERHWTVPIFEDPGKTHKALIKDKQGKVRTFSTVVKNIILDEMTYYLATLTDITELEEARQRAEAAEQSKSEFLANMSHEIRTPMNGIIGFTHLLGQSELTDDQQRQLTVIENSTHTLLSIVNDILDFSKIESGKFELDVVCVNPFSEFEMSFLLFRANAQSKNITYTIDIDSRISECIETDPLRVNQVMSNLIGNAIKFTPEHGNVDVAVTLVESGDKSQRICFSVSDSGIGIPEERQAKIFEAFAQADTSTTRQFGGTGLGLSISSSLVQLMGGTLQLESREGEGSRFYFELDLAVCEEVHHLADTLVQNSIGLICDEAGRYLKVQEQLGHFKVPCTLIDLHELHTVIAKEPFDIVITHDASHCVLLEAADKTKHILLIDEQSTVEPSAKCTVLNCYDSCPSALYNLLIKLEILDHTVPEESKSTKQFALNILVAEDYPVNQMLIAELLEHYGITFDIADNGREAVEMARNNRYDLVFMDVNMPVMNGIDATRLLRTELELELPVIALTANAMPGDKERFLEAGMSDYLSKPIDPTAIEQVFEKYSSFLSVAPKSEEPDTEVPTALENIDVAMQKTSETIGMKGDIVIRLFNQFFTTGVKTIQKLSDAIERNDIDSIEIEAHNLKGVALTLHLDSLVEPATLMETKAHRKEAFDYRHHFETLEKNFETLKKNYMEWSSKEAL